jgi:hypothetical protein
VEDRFRVSASGNKNFTDAHVYCGSGSFTLESEGNRIAMALNVPYFSKGGKFVCKLSATVPATPQPPKCDCGWKKQVQRDVQYVQYVQYVQCHHIVAVFLPPAIIQ